MVRPSFRWLLAVSVAGFVAASSSLVSAQCVPEICDGLDNDCDSVADNGLLKPDGALQYCITMDPAVASVGQVDPFTIRAYHPSGLASISIFPENDGTRVQTQSCGGAAACVFTPSYVQNYEGETFFMVILRKNPNTLVPGLNLSVPFVCPGEYCPPDPDIADFTSWMRSHAYEECVTSFYHQTSLDGEPKTQQKLFLRQRLRKGPISLPYVVNFYDIIATDSGAANISLGAGQGGNCQKYNLWHDFCPRPEPADYLFIEQHMERSYGIDFTFVYHAVPTSYTQQFNMRLENGIYRFDVPFSYYTQYETHSMVHFAIQTVNGTTAYGVGAFATLTANTSGEPWNYQGMDDYVHEWGHTWGLPHNFIEDPNLHFVALDGVMDDSYRVNTSLVDPTDPLERYAMEPLPGVFTDAGTFVPTYNDGIVGTTQLPSCGTVDPAITSAVVFSSSPTQYVFDLTLTNNGSIPVANVRLAAENSAQPGVLLADRIIGSLAPGQPVLHRVTLPAASLQSPGVVFTLDRPDEIAESLESNNAATVPLCFDVDGDGWTTCEGDCADTDARIDGRESVIENYASCFDTLDNDCDGVADWDCAVDVGNETVLLGTVTGGLANMRAGSADDVYESLKESVSGKRLHVVWSFPGVSPQYWYALRVEGFRNSATADNFNFEWTTKRVDDGVCDGTETYQPALTVIKTSDDDRLDLFTLGPPPAGMGAVQFCVRVQDSNTSGSDNKADTLKLDKLYVFPITIDARALSEFTDVGSRINGTSFMQVQSGDGVYEILQEGGADALIHTWKFNAPLGFGHRLYLEGWRQNNTDLDNYQFYFATPVPNVTPEQPGTFQIITGALIDQAVGEVTGEFPFGPDNYAGTVWIRIVDTVPNGATLTRVNIDYLAVRATP